MTTLKTLKHFQAKFLKNDSHDFQDSKCNILDDNLIITDVYYTILVLPKPKELTKQGRVSLRNIILCLTNPTENLTILEPDNHQNIVKILVSHKTHEPKNLKPLSITKDQSIYLVDSQFVLDFKQVNLIKNLKLTHYQYCSIATTNDLPIPVLIITSNDSTNKIIVFAKEVK